MKKIKLQSQREEGQVLLLVLGVIVLFGLFTASLANYATTNQRATVNLRTVRGSQLWADGAVEAAITRARFDVTPYTIQNSAGCLPSTPDNGTTLVVDCSATISGSISTVTLRACRTTGCSSSNAVLEAVVNIDRSGLGANGCPSTPSPSRGDCIPVAISRWSVGK